MSGKCSLTEKQIDWAYKKWLEGYSYRQIGKALYVSYSTIFRAFKKMPREGIRAKVRPELVYNEEE